MTRLELGPEDSAELRLILTGHLSDLRMEIADPEQHDFREMLKRREAFIKTILAKLPELGAAA